MFLRDEEANLKKGDEGNVQLRRRLYARFVRSVRSVEVENSRGAHVVQEEERTGLLIACLPDHRAKCELPNHVGRLNHAS